MGVISLLAIAGCGGGDEVTAVSKAEFTKQADAVCAKSRSQIRAAGAEMNQKYYELEGGETDNKPANLGLEGRLGEEMIDSMLPAMEEQLEGFEALSVPADGEAKVPKMLESYSQAIDELERKGVGALLQFESLYDFQEEAKAYGLDCSVSFNATPG